MNIEEIDSPLIVFGPNYSRFEFVRNIEQLTVTTQLGLKKGVVLNNIIVDSSGRTCKTIKARKKRNYYPSWKFEFFNPVIYIELEVEQIKGEFDLADLKNRVLKIVKRDSNDNVGELRRLIEGARNHKELISAIGKYVDPLEEEKK